jgi:Uma2 family endonuclease
MQTQTKQRYFTSAEYLELEEQAEFRSEYHDGEIVAMTGGSINHNRIVGNLSSALKFALKGQAREVFTNDLRLWLSQYRRYFYPDLMIVAGEPLFHENRSDTITNPIVIVEVLSKSTSSYDRGEKFRYYRSVAELREYILIDQYSFYIEQFVKTSEDEWLFSDRTSGDDLLTFSTLDLQIPLQEIYERVEFNLPAISD